MKRSVLTFGDSNSYGTPPMTSAAYHPRLPDRWPVVMAAALDCDVIEAGLGGRTAMMQSPSGAEMHLDGPLGLRIALLGHGPIDDLVIMLGSNDMQCRYGQTAEMIAGSVAFLLKIAADPEIQERHGGFRTLLVCPPPPLESGTFEPDFLGAPAKATALPGLYAALARAWGCAYLDAGLHIRSDPIDGVHFGSDAHATLGRAVADALR